MGLLSIFTKSKFDDPAIVARATAAIEEDPVVMNPGQVVVASKSGVITLTGAASTERERAHIEGVARSAIKMTGLKFADIVNQITVSR
jgi:hypothetical protein